MEDRCIVCGDVIPEGRQVCPECMNAKKTSDALKWLGALNGLYGTTMREARESLNLAMESLAAQKKLREYIRRLNQPEYTGIVWTKDEVVMLLQELLADRS